jgi:hypothetical protein
MVDTTWIAARYYFFFLPCYSALVSLSHLFLNPVSFSPYLSLLLISLLLQVKILTTGTPTPNCLTTNPGAEAAVYLNGTAASPAINGNGSTTVPTPTPSPGSSASSIVPQFLSAAAAAGLVCAALV